MKRDYLPISSVSLIGSCETKFLQSMLGELDITPAMIVGKEKHGELIEGLPTVTKNQLLDTIKSGERCAFREIFVKDEKLKIIGRIDQLNFSGQIIKGKNEGILIDDKYPIRVYTSLPLSYKIQLAGYVSAIHNSKEFSDICIITKAKLICRDSRTHDIVKEFTVDTDQLRLWESNFSYVTQISWQIFMNEKKPEHRRFDIEKKQWVDCFCNS